MNAVVRNIVLGLGLVALLSGGSGCAVGSLSGDTGDTDTAESALTGGSDTAVVDNGSAASAAPSSDESIHMPQRLTRPLVSAPGTNNAEPADPSPWLDPHGTK